MLSRDDITAALFALGAGSRGWLQEVANEALGAADVNPFADPSRIGVALAWEFRRLTPPDDRVRVEGRRILHLWHPNVGEAGLNTFLGIASALLTERALEPEDADIAKLAGYLALPGDQRDLAVDLKRQVHMPEWFIAAHHRARGLPSMVPKLVVAR